MNYNFFYCPASKVSNYSLYAKFVFHKFQKTQNLRKARTPSTYNFSMEFMQRKVVTHKSVQFENILDFKK